MGEHCQTRREGMEFESGMGHGTVSRFEFERINLAVTSLPDRLTI